MSRPGSSRSAAGDLEPPSLTHRSRSATTVHLSGTVAPNTLVAHSTFDRLRWSGLLAVVVLWCGIGVAAVRTGFPLTGELPLSRLANDPRADPLFGASLVVAAVSFIAFCGFLTRRDHVGRTFTVVMVIAMVGQAIAGIVPIGPEGQSDRVHVIAALILGASIPVFLWRYAAGRSPGRWRRRAWALFAAQAGATAVGIALSRAGIAPLAEIVPALAFHAWVIAVTLHSRGNLPIAVSP